MAASGRWQRPSATCGAAVRYGGAAMGDQQRHAALAEPWPNSGAGACQSAVAMLATAANACGPPPILWQQLRGGASHDDGGGAVLAVAVVVMVIEGGLRRPLADQSFGASRAVTVAEGSAAARSLRRPLGCPDSRGMTCTHALSTTM